MPSLNGSCVAVTRFSPAVLVLLPGKGNDIVHRRWALREKLLDVARGLTDAVLVFDQRDADVALAVFTEAETGRDGDIGLLDQQLGELHRTERVEGLGDRRPGEHRRRRGGMSQPARAKLSTRHRGARGRWQRISSTQSCGPLSAAAAATWIGVKAP